MKLNFTKSNLTKRKKALALLMSMTIAAGLTGCAPKNANVPINAAEESTVCESVGEISSAIHEVQTEESIIKNEKGNNENQNLNTWEFPDDPKDYTVDDYRHMVSVNGITITLPTTINELKKLDEKFGYEVDYVYDGVNQVLPDGGTGYDIFITYDGKKVAYTTVCAEPDENVISDAKITSMIFSHEDTDNAIDFYVFNNIKIGSTLSQIRKVMGEPAESLSESSCTEKYKYTFEKYKVSIVCFYREKEANIFIIDIRENDKNE